MDNIRNSEMKFNLFNYKIFFYKVIIIFVAVNFTLYLSLPDIPKIPETERNKLIFISLIQNPYVFWNLSIKEEESGKFKNAIIYIEAAIGLMEMNGASEKYIEKYRSKLIKLKSQI
jgi:hypothetical protein